MRRWELWVGPGGHDFFPEENHEARDMARGQGLTLAWETTAKSRNEAHRQLHLHLGYGEFKPMLREDGTPYPEDEDDALLPPSG